MRNISSRQSPLRNLVLQGRSVPRGTRQSIGSEKRRASVALGDCRTDSAGTGRPCSLESERPFSVHGRTRTKALHGAGLCFFRALGYPVGVASETVLSYKVECFPTRAKADTLALLSGLFCRLHSDAIHQIVDTERFPTSRGKGEFTGRAYRRAWTDYKRSQKAARVQNKPFTPPTLRAELID